MRGDLSNRYGPSPFLSTHALMTSSTPTPWTIPQPLQEAVALGPGIDAEALRRGLAVLASRADVKALVVFGSSAGRSSAGRWAMSAGRWICSCTGKGKPTG
jgi:hypothetical protein